MYTTKISKKVDKFLEKHRIIARKFVRNLDEIEKNPFHNNLDIKKLTGKPNHYRMRIGKYRFLYEIIEDEILIYFYEADSRGGIY
ncbi:hypothetical protein CSB09_04545 [Candidatus Gracilibacteria bacterium]|nr:MAG: hypothetical protein CSB09_04545 [Candidatus Gracilibacteria bacterium]